MKLVRENINEKFTDDDSDPITDMGIGLLKQLKDDYSKQYSWHNIPIETITLDQLLIFCISHSNKYDLTTIKYLLDAGADPDSGACVYYAVSLGKEFVKLFLDKGINLKSKNSGFLGAMRKKDLEIAQMFLDAGASLHSNGELALRQAISRKGNAEIVKWLIEKGARTNLYNYYALQKALKNREVELVKILMKKYQEEHP
jgi:ankyrin repeat protein